MRTTLTLAAIACAALAASAGTALAQKAGKKGKEMTYTGCLEHGKKAGTYMLTHVMVGKPGEKAAAKHAKAPKMVELSSATVPLSAENGHKVMVMGMTMKHKMETKMKVTGLESLNGSCS